MILLRTYGAGLFVPLYSTVLPFFAYNSISTSIIPIIHSQHANERQYNRQRLAHFTSAKRILLSRTFVDLTPQYLDDQQAEDAHRIESRHMKDRMIQETCWSGPRRLRTTILFSELKPLHQMMEIWVSLPHLALLQDEKLSSSRGSWRSGYVEGLVKCRRLPIFPRRCMALVATRMVRRSARGWGCCC